jgi:hypothetical protein
LLPFKKKLCPYQNNNFDVFLMSETDNSEISAGAQIRVTNTLCTKGQLVERLAVKEHKYISCSSKRQMWKIHGRALC